MKRFHRRRSIKTEELIANKKQLAMPYIQMLEFEISPGNHKAISFRSNILKPIRLTAIEFSFSKPHGESYLCGQSLLEVLRGNFEIDSELFRIPVVVATQRQLALMGYIDLQAREYVFSLTWAHAALIQKPIVMRVMLFCRADMEDKKR